MAKLLIQVFNSAGAGFPSTATVLKPFTVVMAFLVGVGITMASVIMPARRAAKIPPVAAMRPELGFEALSAKRLVAGVGRDGGRRRRFRHRAVRPARRHARADRARRRWRVC